jgi:hypothetical protein
MATFPGFGRTFDFALRACEAAHPWLVPIFKEARLFCFPHNPHAVLPKRREADKVEFWMENFALPYPVTAIEDEQGVVIVWDADALDAEGDYQGDVDFKALLKSLIGTGGGYSPPLHHPLYVSTYPRKGLDRTRFFLSVRGSWSWPEGVAATVSGETAPWVPVGKDHVFISWGIFNIEGGSAAAWKINSDPIAAWCLTKNRLCWGPRLDKPWNAQEVDRHISIVKECKMDIQKEAQTAMEEIMWFSDPDRFVVEETQETSEKRPKKWGKSKRTKERPTYHSWTPLDIRKVRGEASESDGEGPQKRGHHRRGHYRTLRADRYARSGMQGKTILVRPCFVGDETFTVERSHYRVLLGEDDVLVGEQQKNQEKRSA